MVELAYPTRTEQEEFYAALGKAITDWANLESELFEITASILGCTRERAAIVFYRTPTIDSRVTLTGDLVHSFFPHHESGGQPHPSVKVWKQLQKDIKDNLSVRNRLAHQPTSPVGEWEDHTEHRIELKQASLMSQTEMLRRREQVTAEAIGLEEINEHRKIVSSLINRLRDFRDEEFPRPLIPAIE